MAPTTAKDRNLEPRPEPSDLVSQREIELRPPVPISARKCTDCLFLMVFVLYLIGVLVIGIVGFQNGNPARLVYGTDYKGRVCGEVNKTDQPYLVYPRPTEDVLLAGSSVAVDTPWDINFFSVCAERCPLENEIVCDDTGKELLANVSSAEAFQQEARSCLNLEPGCVDSKVKNHCWRTLFNTTAILFRCFPSYIYDVKVIASGCAEDGTEVRFNSATGKNTTTCVKYKEIVQRTTVEPTAEDLLFDSFNTVNQVFQRNMADIVKAWPVILISGLGVSTLVGLFYIISLWLFVRTVVWGSVLGVQLMSIFFTIYLYIKAGIININFVSETADNLNGGISSLADQASTTTGLDLINASPINLTGNPIPLGSGNALPAQFQASLNYKEQFTYAAYFMTTITILLFILILMLARRISRAIEIFQEASHAIRATPCLVLIPFCSVPALLLVVAYFTASTAFIASAGSYTIEQVNLTAPVSPGDGVFEVTSFGTASYSEVFVAYNVIGFLWVSSFITAIVVFVIAGTVGHWYWKGNENGDAEGYGAHPLLRSLYVTFRFHLGSAAFGALMVAIVQFVRYLAAYLETRSKSVTKKSRVMRAIMCLVHCCLKCLEYCVKFISRNAFIISALYGESFCTSTRHAFHTITANLAQVALVTFLGDLILRFGQMLIALMATFSCWVYLDNRPEYDVGGHLELSTFWFPTLLTGLLSWFIANECLSIYDITVDTLLISFCQDQKLKKHLDNEHRDLKSTHSMKNFVDRQKQKELDDIDAIHQQRRDEVENDS